MGKDRHENRGVFQNIYIDRNSLLNAIVNSIGEGLIALDNDGRIFLINPVAESLTGWLNSEAMGKNIDQIYVLRDPIHRTRVNSLANLSVFEDQQTFSLQNQFVLVPRTGTEIEIIETSAPIIDQKKNMVGVVLIFRPIRS